MRLDLQHLILLLAISLFVQSPNAQGPAVGCQGNPDPYLIFITINNISRVNIDGSGNETIVTGLSNGVAIDYDYYNDRMYWTDVSLGHIKTAPLSTGCPITTLVSGLSIPDGIAIDWVNDKIYWTDTGTNTLEQSDLYGYSRRVLFNDTDEPRGIALDPLNDALYMTDWGTSPRIEKMHLDGSGRVTIVTQNLVWPNAVTIDFTGPALYWADSWTDIIARGDLDGNNIVILLRGADTYHPFSITVYGDYLYWTDWSLNSVERISKHTPNSARLTIVNGYSRPSGMQIVQPCRQAGGGDLPTSVNIRTSQVCLAYSITTSWDPVTVDSVCGPVSYDVTILPSDGVTMTRVNDTSYNFTGMTLATSYTVTVTGRNYAGTGKPSTLYVPNMAETVPSGVTHLTNTTYRLDLIIVTWDPASSPYCGEVLYYQVVISSDEHVNIPNNIVNATCLAVTFLGLRSNTTYTITVAAVNKAGIGMGDSITVKTAATEVIAGPGSNIQIQIMKMTSQQEQ
ncbi:low-density lipoprotein receptor-related protein 5-like isoform X2 [Dysidea avara]|uniref:low-density lipoprotein receptor-related protein 5-like isoform X2 n=1 Tax=Dysidea avara TaxID=196820 RepID=UPI00331A403E